MKALSRIWNSTKVKMIVILKNGTLNEKKERKTENGTSEVLELNWNQKTIAQKPSFPTLRDVDYFLIHQHHQLLWNYYCSHQPSMKQIQNYHCSRQYFFESYLSFLIKFLTAYIHIFLNISSWWYQAYSSWSLLYIIERNPCMKIYVRIWTHIRV